MSPTSISGGYHFGYKTLKSREIESMIIKQIEN